MLSSTDNIATFVEVVRRRSLSAAARKLELPKSTVSRRLSRLEQQLQSQLLQRDARRVSLTQAGKRFYDSVASAVDTLELAVSEQREQSRAPSGMVRVSAPPDLGRRVLAPMFVAFLKQYPLISLDLIFTSRLVDLVEEGVDLAVRAGRVTEGQLVARPLCASELQLAVGSSHALAGLNDDDPRSLAALPFVLHRTQGRTQLLRLESGQGKRRRVVEVSVSGRVSVDDYAALSELVAAGQGVGLLPRLHVQEGLEAGRLRRILPGWSARASQIYLVSISRQKPERVRLLSQFLISAFASVEAV